VVAGVLGKARRIAVEFDEVRFAQRHKTKPTQRRRGFWRVVGHKALVTDHHSRLTDRVKNRI
jgi:hypothetical protein